MAAVDRRVAADAAGKARDAAAPSVEGAGACRASIVDTVGELSRAIDARGYGERALAMQVVAVVKFELVMTYAFLGIFDWPLAHR